MTEDERQDCVKYCKRNPVSFDGREVKVALASNEPGPEVLKKNVERRELEALAKERNGGRTPSPGPRKRALMEGRRRSYSPVPGPNRTIDARDRLNRSRDERDYRNDDRRRDIGWIEKNYNS